MCQHFLTPHTTHAYKCCTKGAIRARGHTRRRDTPRKDQSSFHSCILSRVETRPPVQFPFYSRHDDSWCRSMLVTKLVTQVPQPQNTKYTPTSRPSRHVYEKPSHARTMMNEHNTVNESSLRRSTLPVREALPAEWASADSGCGSHRHCHLP